MSPRCATSPGPGKGGRGGAQASRERGGTSFDRLREPADPAREGEPEETRGRGQSRDPARPRPPQRGLRSPLLPSPGGAGREHKRLQLPSGRGPTPPTPGPGPTRGEEAGKERQGCRDPGRQARVEGRRRPRPPLTRPERSAGSRAARKEAVPPHSGAEGRERGREEKGGPGRSRRAWRLKREESAAPP
ncbi:octapeptide-repeat protein T2-like [Pseudorca crassidens]|uniref:octapeptide-repeat protein T2-like n=1 Tax=Pseudorca crassidens TaxID=82174 RepID=UPI00352E825F